MAEQRAAATGWSNWAGNQHAAPVRVSTPPTEEALAQLVGTAASEGLRVRAVGAGHSFTACAATDGVQVRLDRLSGITRADRYSGEVTVLAGTPLRAFNDQLHVLGLALPNLGDVDQQTVAGALSTGTHGTGLGHRVLAAGVTGLRIVTADGAVHACSATENPELFRAAQVGFGSLGVISEYTIRAVPRRLLHAEERPEPLERVLEQFDSSIRTNEHFEFFWFPHTRTALTKRNNPVPEGTEPRPLPTWRSRLDDDLLSNRLYEQVNRGLTRMPRLTPRVNQVSARALSARSYTDWSHRVFVTQRDVRFIEAEWAFPVQDFCAVFGQLRRWVQANDELTAFPVECRVAGADDLWLSTAGGRDSCYVALHKYHRQVPGRYFAEFEAFARDHGGRPHWGKLHGCGPDYLGTVYPRFGDFLRLRDAVDPARVFANDYTRQVLGD